jgi:cation diffusion facilitator family transporter
MHEQAHAEKRHAAASSVLAAVGLTAGKIIVGVATGSLGILAEAAHSGLDLAAALMTLFAVRISAKPADDTHLYGHGKIENLSALLETALLLVTCAWVLLSAGRRLLSGSVEVEVTFWSFAVMVVSVIVDISRSRMLYRVAHKYKSQALEADALHFSTDIWSSAVVIVGLAGVKVAEYYPSLRFLRYADAVAAIFVALIVVGVSVQLGVRAINSLIDAAPPGLQELIVQAAEAVPGVINCHNARLRYSGSQLFVDAHVYVDGSQSLQQAHDLTDEVEVAINKLIPGADVTVHAEPAPPVPAAPQGG